MTTNHRSLWSIYRTQFANAPELSKLAIPKSTGRKRKTSSELSAAGVERAVRGMRCAVNSGEMR
jgi:hypothetical protein